MTAPVARTSTGSIWHRLYHGETAYDFVGRTRRWFLISGAIIVIGAVSLLGQGLKYGIDFRGGTAWSVKAAHVSVGTARSALRGLGLGDATIQVVGGNSIRVQADIKGTTDAQRKRIDDVTTKLAEVGHTTVSNVSVDTVGPSWGKTVTNKARTALIVFFILIAGYISFRFEWKMAVAAIIAVVHDILVTLGIYSISRFEVTPATVVAFLTILGYSLYDTVVVFDKVQENTRGMAATGRMTYSETVNLSMNQVLMRSINTSLVAIMPIVSVLVIGAFALGATTLKDFGLALLVGLLTGAYSSIFIASPILALLKERETRYATIRQRAASRGAAAGAPLTPAAAAALAGNVSARPSGEGDGEGRVEPAAGRARPVPVNRPRPGARPAGRPGRPRSKKRGRRR